MDLHCLPPKCCFFPVSFPTHSVYTNFQLMKTKKVSNLKAYGNFFAAKAVFVSGDKLTTLIPY